MRLPPSHSSRGRRRASLLWAAVFALAGRAPAQRPSARPTRLAADESVRVDGVLDDAPWSRASTLGPLTQVSPAEGAPPGAATEVRLAYDADFLYLALVCHEEPGAVRARQRDRDANIRYDDVVELWIDTFNDATSAFWFQITPGGSRGDALLSGGGQRFNKDWDGIWFGRARVTHRGWEAELAIPYQTLSFRDGEDTWGFNLSRRRVVAGERQRWASPSNAYRSFDLAVGGSLEGLAGIEQGAGLDVVPYVKASADRGGGHERPTWRGDVGLDLLWRPTPGSAMRVTLNTDFAETEVDERRVNLSRFPLFFPEKRDFFLEDAGLFDFGAPGNGRALLPFFSRTIGRDAGGAAVPIDVGLKYTGRHGPWSVGVLDVRQGASEVDDDRNLTVARAQYDLGGEAIVGGLATLGRPSGDGDAATAGMDLRLGSSTLFGAGRSGRLWLWGVETRADGADDGRAFGAEGQARSSAWSHTLRVQRIEEAFDPALGFVRRTGVDQARAETRYTWRTGGEASWLRSYDARLALDVTHDRVGDEDSWALPFRPLGLRFGSEDQLQYELHSIREALDDGFELGDVPVGAGEYDMVRHILEFDGAPDRRLLGEVELEYGDYYSGTLQRLSLEPTFVPSGTYMFGGAFTDVTARLEAGDYHTQLYGLRFGVTPGPDVAWKNLVQYDTESKELGLQSRLRWILEPGRDLFLVGLFGWSKPEHEAAFRSAEQELALKLTYTWRF